MPLHKAVAGAHDHNTLAAAHSHFHDTVAAVHFCNTMAAANCRNAEAAAYAHVVVAAQRMWTDAVRPELKQLRSQVHGGDGLLSRQGLSKQVLRRANADGM